MDVQKNTNRNGLFWFTNDLRIHDNPALANAARSLDTLVCVYCLDSKWFTPNRFGSTSLGLHRQQFLEESLHSLRQELAKLKQTLFIVNGPSETSIKTLIDKFKINQVFRSRNAGWNEKQTWERLVYNYNHIHFSETDSHTLFDLDSLPCELQSLPVSFTKFRKMAEPHQTEKPIKALTHLPPTPVNANVVVTNDQVRSKQLFYGGEAEGFKHLKCYFSGNLPARYKEVRNAIDGWDNSCKFSPWLANGSLSSREILYWLHQYETSKTKNDSTYWIYFELLWREYFQWSAHKIGPQLFRFSGLKKSPPLNSYYPERFKKWVAGNTPFPLVNACMKELAATGYLSNRGRQIVASYLINELSVDWRYGAAYFEQVLLDYDVAINWGNWQYIAGVGSADKRHFNIDKQTHTFDAQGAYRSKWDAGLTTQTLDSVDAADWPI